MYQITPCNIEMYAVYKEEYEMEFSHRVLAFRYDGEGNVMPMVFCPNLGIIAAENDVSKPVRYVLKNGILADIEESPMCGDDIEDMRSILGGISGSLRRLVKCITEGQESSRFCITGDVTSY